MKIKSIDRNAPRSRRISQRGLPKPKGSSTLSLRFCFYVFAFSLLAVYLFASAGRAETASARLDPIDLLVSHSALISENTDTPNTAMQAANPRLDQRQTQAGNNVILNFITQVGEKLAHLFMSKSPPANSELKPDTAHSTSRLERQLWQARIGTPEGKEHSKSKNELLQIIKQIRSIQFKPPPKAPEPLIVVEPVQKTEPNEILSDAEVPPEQMQKKVGPKLPFQPVTDQTLQMFENLSQHPEQLHNPFKLGEILFRSNKLKQAAVCYQQALNTNNTGDPKSTQNTAWILFQIGNCLRNDDPVAAMQTYRQLIAEYPGSPWADFAKTRANLIDWYLKDKPRTLIDENQ